jgi:hypothetical protein
MKTNHLPGLCGALKEFCENLKSDTLSWLWGSIYFAPTPIPGCAVPLVPGASIGQTCPLHVTERRSPICCPWGDLVGMRRACRNRLRLLENRWFWR